MAGRSYQPSLPYRNARKRSHVPAPPTTAQRLLHALFGLAIAVLVANGLIGERGLLESLQARRQLRTLQTEVERLRDDNARLRHQARRLLRDSAAIEEIARRDLGFIRPGEIVFLLRDTPPAEDTRRARVR